VAATFADAVRNLPSYTDSSGAYPKGLFWHSSDMQYSWQRASVSLNAFGLFAVRVMNEFTSRAPAGGVVDAAVKQKPWASLVLAVPPRLTSSWQRALERELLRQVQDLHSSRWMPPCSGDCYDSWDILAEVRAGLGFKWTPSDWQSELSMERLFCSEALAALSPLGLANAALSYTLHSAYYSLPSEAQGRLDEVYGRLSNLIRIQGRTAYVASSSGSPHSAGLMANAMVLLALSRAGESALARHFAANSGASLPAKLAAYVADGGEVAQSVRFGGGSWVSPRDAAMVSVALAAYDQAMGMTAPDLVFKASSDAIGLLDYEAHGKAAPPAATTTPWEALAHPPSPVQFRASGVGQVSVVATMTFVPAVVPTEGAVYRGIFVEKVVRQMDAEGRAIGPPLQVIKLGTSVVVTIQITTPDDLSRVTLEDFVSGGLEPVDASVAGDTRGSSAGGGCGEGDMPFRFLWWCAPSFYSLAIRPDRVLWSSQNYLPAGTHTVSYQATAATRGVFVLPPAHAYVNGQPELMGLSKGGTVVVAGASPNSPALPDPRKPASVLTFLARLGVHPAKEEAPRGCPGGCPNGGVCQLSTGKCGCYRGMVFKEGDCPHNRSDLSMSVLLGEDAEPGMASNDFSSASGGLPSIEVVATVSIALVAVAFVGFHVHKHYGFSYSSDVEDAPYSAAPAQETEMSSLMQRMPSVDSALGAGPYL